MLLWLWSSSSHASLALRKHQTSYQDSKTNTSSWLTVPWLYPAEIFPLEVRAKGNAWGVVGWSIGNGWLTLLCPVMFEAIGEYTLFIFAACNIITIPMVWALYPESNQRTLEEMNLLFAADSIWAWEAEKNYAILKEENPELVQAAQRGKSVSSAIDVEATGGRKASLVAHSEGRRPSLATGAQRRSSLGAGSETTVTEGKKEFTKHG